MTEREILNLTWKERLDLLREQKDFYDGAVEPFRIKSLPFAVAINSLEEIWKELVWDDVKDFVMSYISAMWEWFGKLELTEQEEEFYHGWVGAVAGILMNDKEVIEWVRKMMNNYKKLEELEKEMFDLHAEKEKDISAIKAEIKVYFDKIYNNDKREKNNG